MNLFIHTINKPSESQRVQCDRDRIRTYDRLLRRQMLYPAELRDLSINLVGVAGFEPATSASQTRRDNRLRYTPKRRRDTDSNPVDLCTSTYYQNSPLPLWHLSKKKVAFKEMRLQK